MDRCLFAYLCTFTALFCINIRYSVPEKMLSEGDTVTPDGSRSYEWIKTPHLVCFYHYYTMKPPKYAWSN